MKKIHFTDRYLLNPRHPVTVLCHRSRRYRLTSDNQSGTHEHGTSGIGHPGLHVTVFDPDTVSQANIGRQLFSETELGLNKAVSACHTHQPFLRIRMDYRTAMFSYQEFF